MIAFALVALSEAWPEIRPLAEAHYRELRHFDDLPFEPDLDRYLTLETAGVLRIFAAREEDAVIGYSAFTVAPSLHHRLSLQAFHVALYLLPEYRGRSIARRMIEHGDQALRAEGCQVVWASSHIAQPIDPVLRRCGYQAVDVMYAKRLDR